MKNSLVVCLLFLCIQPSRQLLHAQPGVTLPGRPAIASYPQGYFRWPVDLKPDIVANLGELRPNHWHMGLDVRTDGKENQRVYAAADGYISHIGIRPGSFGRFLMIRHPNGFTTLYGHLNEFAPEIEAYVSSRQYEQESWAIELDPPATDLPVRKGDFISFSGNTGGSQGPHVHFEIRSTVTDECLNPLMFGFPLADAVRPSLVQLAIYDRSRSTYFTIPKMYAVKSAPGGYIIPGPAVISTDAPVISLGVRAFDRRSGTQNQDGIYAARVYVDDVPVSGFDLDSISYDETGYYNSHVDYRYAYRTSRDIQHLSRLPNDRSGVYHSNGDGLYRFTDTSAHAVRVELYDASLNTSSLNFQIRYSGQPVAYHTESGEMLPPGGQAIFQRPGFEMRFRDSSIYDTAVLQYRSMSGAAGALSPVYTLGDESIPVHGTVDVRIKPETQLRELKERSLLIVRTGRSAREVKGAIWEEDWLVASFSDFGSFQAVEDQVPPGINAPGTADTINLSSASRILFTPTDNFGIASFRAELDGGWLRFTNDKRRNWIYRFDERCPFGVHLLKVTVTDLAGNQTVREWWFRREAYTAPARKVTGKKSSTGKKAAQGKRSSNQKTSNKKSPKKPAARVATAKSSATNYKKN